MLAAAGVGEGGGSSGPSLDDVLAPYIQARQAANESHDAAVPVIHDAFNDLIHSLNAGQADSRQQSRQESRGARRDVQAGQQQNRAQGRSAQNDLAAAAGDDVAGSLAAMLSGETGRVGADMRASARDDRALANRIDQVGRQETNATREDSRLAKAGALGTAQNNLDSILNAIGLEQAQAESAWQASQSEASSGSEAAASGAQLELQQSINQATAAAAQSALSATLGAGQPWQKALDLVRADAQNLASGLTDYGVNVDPRAVIKIIRQLGPASQSNADAQRRQASEGGGAGGGQDINALLQQLGIGAP
jgi:hypothetical protein